MGEQDQELEVQNQNKKEMRQGQALKMRQPSWLKKLIMLHLYSIGRLKQNNTTFSYWNQKNQSLIFSIEQETCELSRFNYCFARPRSISLDGNFQVVVIQVASKTIIFLHLFTSVTNPFELNNVQFHQLKLYHLQKVYTNRLYLELIM